MNKNEVVAEFEKNIQSGYKIKKRIEKSLKSTSLSKQKFQTLIDLRLAGRSKLKEMAEDTGSSPQTLCIMYNNLEKESLIKREIDEKDRRNVYYSVTKEGDQLLKTAITEIKNAILAVLNEMDEKDVVEFGRALKTINKIVEENF